MTQETLTKSNDLSKSIGQTKQLLDNCNTQKTEWVEFTYGNGSSASVVCNDKEVIEIVRLLLVAFHTAKLERLEKEFSSL